MSSPRANGPWNGLLRAVEPGYDVIVLDRMLPELDGLGVVTRLRSAGIRTPVLFLTDLSGIDDRVEGLAAGGDDYLVKPFAFAEFLARLIAPRATPAVGRAEGGPGFRRSGNGLDQEDGCARRRANRIAAARVPPAGVPGAQRRASGDAENACSKTSGIFTSIRKRTLLKRMSVVCGRKSIAGAPSPSFIPCVASDICFVLLT